MLWEERRVFTVSELSKVEQGAKVWFLFGSQGTWHTKCFYKEKKGRFGSEFSEISWFPFGCSAAVAFLSNSPFQGKVWSSLELRTSFQQNMPFSENAELARHVRNSRQVPGVARLGWRHATRASVRFSANFTSSWAGKSRPRRTAGEDVLLRPHLQGVHWESFMRLG